VYYFITILIPCVIVKEKYEVHHGVRITDSALVSSVINSHRYIADRFLPDKAIDLIDEAASRLRLQQESKPEPIENLDRAIITLKIEAEALAKVCFFFFFSHLW